MEGDLHTLQEIKGIGDKISEKIIKSVGGEEELQKIIDDIDVERSLILTASAKEKLFKL